jgi:hypothetical protein
MKRIGFVALLMALLAIAGCAPETKTKTKKTSEPAKTGAVKTSDDEGKTAAAVPKETAPVEPKTKTSEEPAASKPKETAPPEPAESPIEGKVKPSEPAAPVESTPPAGKEKDEAAKGKVAGALGKAIFNAVSSGEKTP